MSEISSPLVSLYIHWPFCISKCPYCDFFSLVKEVKDENLFKETYLKELQSFSEFLGPCRLKSIFFGGGTPSLMSPSLVACLIDNATNLFPPLDNIEITLEANPHTVDQECFQDFLNAGVNRISLGVQSFKDESLKFLGRNHTAHEAKTAIKTALKIFPRVSFDLIYALPHQTLEEWRKELEEALNFQTSHLSLYQLTIEEGTAFHTSYQRKDFFLPDQDTGADLYELTEDILRKNNLHPYEISNYSQPGYESVHNLTYWNYEDYIGIGPGAHSRYSVNGKKFAAHNPKSVEKWTEQDDQGKTTEPLSRQTQAQEQLMMGLRLQVGILKNKLVQPLGQSVDQQKLSALIQEGYITDTPQSLFLTDKGRRCHSAILNYILNQSNEPL